MLCFDPAIITVFTLLFESTHAVFYATKMSTASTTGLPHLSDLNEKFFHENGFHGEVVGFAAKREEECGIVLLDYRSYTNGDMFNHILKKFEETLKDNSTLDRALRAKVFAIQKEQAMKDHIEEMIKLFESHGSNTPHYNTAQVTFFPGLGLIAFGIGVGIGKLVYDGVTSLARSFVKGEQVEHLDMELIAVHKRMDNLAKILEVQINKNRFESVLALVRTQLVFAVQNALYDLFSRGRVADQLISHRGENNLLSAIARLMGEKRFNASMLKNRYFAAGNTLTATVISMNKHLMEVEVCYPITKEQDVGYLLRIVSLGKFNDDGKTYATHDLGAHYILPLSMNVSNISALARVDDIRSDCDRMSSVFLCKTQLQSNTCTLDRKNRGGCALLTYDSNRENFTLVQPLLRTIVLATRLKTMHYQAVGETIHAPVEIPEPVTVVEIPEGGVLYVGLAVVKARVTTGNLTLELQITLPVSNMSEPVYVSDDNYDDAVLYSYGCRLNSLLLAVFSLIIALFSLSVNFFLYNQLRAIQRWVQIQELLKEAQREPIKIVAV